MVGRRVSSQQNIFLIKFFLHRFSLFVGFKYDFPLGILWAQEAPRFYWQILCELYIDIRHIFVYMWQRHLWGRYIEVILLSLNKCYLSRVHIHPTRHGDYWKALVLFGVKLEGFLAWVLIVFLSDFWIEYMNRRLKTEKPKWILNILHWFFTAYFVKVFIRFLLGRAENIVCSCASVVHKIKFPANIYDQMVFNRWFAQLCDGGARIVMFYVNHEIFGEQ